MSIHIHSLKSLAVQAETAKSNAGGRSNLAAEFRVLLDELQTKYGSSAISPLGGLAAAGAASAAARSAATAASASALAAATAPALPANNNGTAASPAAALSDPSAVATAEQVFGPAPWLANPMGTGPYGFTFGYNPIYFASPSAAAQVAQMLGGKVVQENEFTKDTPGTPFAQLQPNQMVELPSGARVNAGVIASFYMHGYPNWMVNQQIANEVAGAEAAVASTGT